MRIIGNGVDIIEVKRIRDAVGRYGESFLERIFTEKELKAARQHNSFYQHLAGRFAVKEAVFKAFSQKRLSFKDVEVLNDSKGKPCCSLLTGEKERFDVHISISHIKNYAVASAIITQEDNQP